MTLAKWQDRLRRHFEELRRQRTAAVGDKPLFALEHGLAPPEFDEMAAAVRAHVCVDPPSKDHALPWIVYAAELGYGYSGDEYWQTFEEKTPGWNVRGDRHWLRSRYQSFQKTFGGAEPAGSWAAHFSIICWPITHAILPQDLQRQLARILYEMRHSFSAELFEAPERLGRFIRDRSWNATSRFQQLVQEPQLVGQLAAALLLQGQFGTRGLIDSLTLQRIGHDLDRERRAREWLRGARRFAQERVNIRGLASGRDVGASPVSNPDDARAEITALGIEPRLVLRPTAPDAACWDVSLEIPDLSHLMFRFPNARDVLIGSRCVVAGTSGRPLARGRFLHSAQRIQLARWPREDEVLLKFERADEQLEYLLRTECLLRSGPYWLFRIASDGLAYESRNLRVRPGQRYILVGAEGLRMSSDLARLVEVECEGVHAWLLDLPEAITADWEDAIRRFGLRQAKTVEVWPAGLGAVVWDGEGHAEWLASERPCIAIQTDHAISGLLVSMGTERNRSLEFTAITPGEPIFVQLPDLPVGVHKVRVSTRSAAADEEALGDLDVVMRIREARPWSPGVDPHGPLVVEIEPVAPTLEELWEGRVEVSVRGPAGRRLKCAVSLREAESGPTTARKVLSSIPLPVNPAVWRSHFERQFQQMGEVQAVYDTARICELEFTCEALGAFTIRCERDFTPLRWAIRRDGQRHMARLLDDSGAVDPAYVARMAFETPCVEEPLGPGQTYEIPSTGGLYLARRGESSAAVIIPPTAPVRDFADLRCVPRIERRERTADALLQAVAVARMWSRARLSGNPLAAIRRRDVLWALAHHIFRVVGGDGWAAAENAVTTGPNGLSGLKQAVSKRRDENAIAAALALECAALADAPCQERVRRLGALATTLRLLPAPERQVVAEARSTVLHGRPFSEADPVWLSELGLRLASAPGGVEDWAGAKLKAGMTRLLEIPTLARAARFLVIATDRHLQSRAAPGELYASWGWA